MHWPREAGRRPICSHGMYRRVPIRPARRWLVGSLGMLLLFRCQFCVVPSDTWRGDVDDHTIKCSMYRNVGITDLTPIASSSLLSARRYSFKSTWTWLILWLCLDSSFNLCVDTQRVSYHYYTTLRLHGLPCSTCWPSLLSIWQSSKSIQARQHGKNYKCLWSYKPVYGLFHVPAYTQKGKLK